MIPGCGRTKHSYPRGLISRHDRHLAMLAEQDRKREKKREP